MKDEATCMRCFSTDIEYDEFDWAFGPNGILTASWTCKCNKCGKAFAYYEDYQFIRNYSTDI